MKYKSTIMNMSPQELNAKAEEAKIIYLTKKSMLELEKKWIDEDKLSWNMASNAEQARRIWILYNMILYPIIWLNMELDSKPADWYPPEWDRQTKSFKEGKNERI